MRLFTIGFAKKTAREFFTTLIDAGVKRVVDVRLSNRNPLSGFTRKDHLPYLLEQIGGIGYVHLTELAPTEELFKYIKAHERGNGYDKTAWALYEKEFLKLMQSRVIEEHLQGVLHDGDCLLCSERTADQCHRRLVAEYLKKHWPDVEIDHLVSGRSVRNR